MSCSLSHPVYTAGSVQNAASAIGKITSRHQQYSDKKHVAFVGLRGIRSTDDYVATELDLIRGAFPGYIVEERHRDWFLIYPVTTESVVTTESAATTGSAVTK